MKLKDTKQEEQSDAIDVFDDNICLCDQEGEEQFDMIKDGTDFTKFVEVLKQFGIKVPK